MSSTTFKKVQPATRSEPSKIPLLQVVSSTARVVGYARVSTEEQILDVQITALKAAHCTNMFVEKVSAVSAKRPMFNLMMKFLERGDTLVVYAFSRISRDLKQLLTIVDELRADGIRVISTTEPHIDPYTTNGRLLISVTGAVDENERSRVKDRTKDAMQLRIRAGMYIGAPPKVTPDNAKEMKAQRKAGVSVKAIAKRFKVSPGAVYSHTNK